MGTVAENTSGWLVRLTSFGEQRLYVIRLVRDLTGLGLRESKELVDSHGVVQEGLAPHVAEKVRAKLEAVGATAVVEPMEGTARDDSAYRVHGRVTDAAGGPVAGVLVRALDRDLRSAEPLGEASTSAEGSYEITYDEESFGRAEKLRADLELRVYDETGGRLRLSNENEGRIVFNAERDQEIDLRLDASSIATVSEWERLEVAVEPLLDGAEPPSLDSNDVAFLVAEMELGELEEEFPAGEASLPLFASAHRHAVDTGLPASLFYGWGRRGLGVGSEEGGVDLEALMSASRAELEESIAAALEQRIVPTSLAEDAEEFVARALELAATRADERLESLRVRGRLVAREGGLALARHIVVATASDGTRYDLSTDHDGRFELTHRLSEGEPARFGVEVLEPLDQQTVAETELEVVDASAVQLIAIDTLTDEPIAEVASRLSLANVPSSLSDLTTGQIRKAGGAAEVEGLVAAVGEDGIRRLQGWVALEPLAPSPETRLQLLELGLDNPQTIAAMPRSIFMDRHGADLGEAGASIHRTASMQARWLEGVRVALAAPGLDAKLLPEPLARLAERDDDPAEARCECEDCESAVGPRAYLVDLLDYVATHVTLDSGSGSEPLELTRIDELLHRDIAALPDSCSSVKVELRQVRIAVEVLRRMLSAAGRDAAVQQAVTEHVEKVYRDLLNQTGVALERLQALQSGPAEERTAVAGRIGIGPERLDELYVERGDLDEATLAELFGFETTQAGGTASSEATPSLSAWRRERLEEVWREQDWPDGAAGEGEPWIDPDLFTSGDFVLPAGGGAPNPAFELWSERLLGPDGVEPLTTELRRTARSLDGLETLVDARLESSLQALRELRARGDDGEEIDEELAALHLSWSSLLRLLELADALEDGPLADAIWEEVFAITVQAAKGMRAATWRQEEHDRGITLRPDLFEEPSDAIDERLEAEPWLAWRIDSRRRRSLARALRSRRQQIEESDESLATTVSAVEESRLPELRDALIDASGTPGVDLAEQSEGLEERLLLGLRDSGCRTTTRVAHALETLQSLVFALRAGALEMEGIEFAIHSDDFDEEWRWMGTYASWKAAMTVFLFPETVLLPELRRRQSPVFRGLVERLRQRDVSPNAALAAAAEYSEYFEDLTSLRIEACVHTHLEGLEEEVSGDGDPDIPVDVYFFARGGRTGRLYEAVQRLESDTMDLERRDVPIPEEDLSFWSPVPVKSFEAVVGVAQFMQHLYLFLKLPGKEGEELGYVRRDLRSGEWEAEPTTLELPRRVTRFDAAVEQRLSSFASSAQDRVYYPAHMAPHLLVLLPGGDLYSLKLGRDVFDWLELGDVRRLDEPEDAGTPPEGGDTRSSGDSGQWQLLRAGGERASKPYALQGLHAAVQLSTGFCVLARDARDRIVYRIFGGGDDGIWRVIASGDFLGAFYWPRMTSVYVYYGDTEQPRYRTIDRQGRLRARRSVSTGGQLLGWVSRVAGSIPAMRYVNEQPDLDFLREGLEEDGRRGEIHRLVDRMVRHLVDDPYVDSYVEAVRRVWSGRSLRFLARSTASELGPERIAGYGLTRLASLSGLVRERRHVMAWQFTDPAGLGVIGGVPNAGVFRLGVAMDRHLRLVPRNRRLLAPRVERERSVRLASSVADRDERRAAIEETYRLNAPEPRPVPICVEEAYFHLPMFLGLRLQRSGQFREALDWYRSVLDYSLPEGERKIYYGLVREESFSGGLERAEEWLADPLDPHGIASVRPHASTRFTLTAIARCLLEYAEAKFVQDTGEALARARVLYDTALDVLSFPVMARWESECRQIVLELEGAISDPAWSPRWKRLIERLGGVENRQAVEKAGRALRGLVASGTGAAETVDKAEELVGEALGARKPAGTQNERLDGARRRRRERANSLLGAPELAAGAASLGRGRGYGSSFPVGRAALHAFCVPPNPAIEELRMKAEIGLHNLRHCRNLAGMSRPVETYSASAEVVLPTVSGGGTLEVPQAATLQPTIYRYEFLIGRAKELVAIAQQIEQGFLSSLERRDAELVGLLQARQGIQLARAGVRLEDLRLREAEDGVGLAELQKERAGFQRDHYRQLLAEPISKREQQGLDLLGTAATWHMIAAISQAAAAAGQAAAATAYFVDPKASAGAGLSAAASAASALAGMGSSFAAKASTKSSIEMTWASFERRTQEWIFQAQLAGQDTGIGRQQVRLARDRVRVVNQEHRIAELRADHAEATADFLANKFTNAELYDWIAGMLEGVYAYFLRQAAAMARLAEAQLAFERQQPTAGMIEPDYWTVERNSFAGEEREPPDRRGLTGSTRLLRDLHRLDQHALETDARDLQISKTISLSRLDPIAFQGLRETGVMVFDTSTELFNRDFPGHYRRLIQRVRASAVALVPPAQGIRATLGTSGISRVLVGGPTFREVAIRRPPEHVALSSPVGASGVFELDQEPAKLRPFEGSGVDTRWEVRLPQASNPFDFATLADVLLTIDYTALHSDELAHRVVREMDPYQVVDRVFSFRHELADAWYDLHNPDQTSEPMTVRFRTGIEDFPPHMPEPEITQVALYFARRSGETFEMTIDSLQLEPDEGPAVPPGGATTIAGIASTRRGNAAEWLPLIGASPVGTWTLSLPHTRQVRERFEQETLTDIVLVIGCQALRPAWPE